MNAGTTEEKKEGWKSLKKIKVEIETTTWYSVRVVLLCTQDSIFDGFEV